MSIADGYTFGGGRMKLCWKSLVSFDSTSEPYYPGWITAAWVNRAIACGIALFVVIVASSMQSVTVAQTSATPAWQKAAGGKMSFEVASVRPSESRDLGAFPLTSDSTFRQTGGLFRASFPLYLYIEFAYKLFETPEGRHEWLSRAPKWVATDNYAIQAKAPIGNPTKDQFRLMIQSLLADRFNLKLHFENRQTPVLALTLIKPGILGQRIRAHSEGPPCPTKTDDSAPLGIAPDLDVWPRLCFQVSFTPAPVPTPPNVVQKASVHNHMAGGRDVSMETIIGGLNNLSNLGRPIIDRTGLRGTFDFILEWAPLPGDPYTMRGPGDPESDFVGTTFPEAVKEQLGMKLESTNAPFPTLIIDHIERPSEN